MKGKLQLKMQGQDLTRMIGAGGGGEGESKIQEQFSNKWMVFSVLPLRNSFDSPFHCSAAFPELEKLQSKKKTREEKKKRKQEGKCEKTRVFSMINLYFTSKEERKSQ